MSELKTIKLHGGLTLKTDIDRQDVLDAIVTYYNENRYREALWDCPLCFGDLDAVQDERTDGMYEDCYACVGDCNILITHITPDDGREYHEIDNSEWTILAEYGLGGIVAPWDAASDDEGGADG